MLSPQGTQPQALEINDFSGGITDNFVAGPPNYYKNADNFVITTDNKLLTRPGLKSSIATRIATNVRISKQFNIDDTHFQISNKKVYHDIITAVTTPVANDPFSAGDTFSRPSVAIWNKHAILANEDLSQIRRVFKDSTTWKCQNLGLPAISGVTLTPNAGANDWLYAFHYEVSYTSQGVTFSEVGAVQFLAATAFATGTTINIPTLANGATYLYDTGSIKIKIYRTVNDGSAYYYVGEVTNGTATYTDNSSDATIQAAGILLYTTGDVPEYDEPPPAKYVSVVNDVLYLGHVKEGSVTYPNRLRISNRFKLYSCPAEFAEDFDDEITGLSQTSSYLIVFCKSKTYRLEGFYNEDGSGQIVKKIISDTVGCIDSQSIINTEEGIFFAGNNGFYYTNGGQVTPISIHLPDTYFDLTSGSSQKEKIQGTYDPLNGRVYWTMMSENSSTEPDVIFVGHIRNGVNRAVPFTTWSGEDSFVPSSIFFFNGVLYLGHSDGYLLEFSSDSHSDIRVDTTLAASSWVSDTIIYIYESCSFDFGTSALRKWVPMMTLNLDNTSSVSLEISSSNDNTGAYTAMKQIVSTTSIPWGDASIPWGSTTVRWNYNPIIDHKRRFPMGTLRCSYKQIKFTNHYTEISSSETLGLATFDGIAATAVLGGSYEWREDSYDYYISTASDSYNTQFQVLTVSGNTITIDNSSGLLPTDELDWVIKGYKRDEITKIISYAIEYSTTSPTQHQFKST